MRDLFIIPREGKDSKNFFQKRIPAIGKNVDLLNEYIKDNSINLEEESSMYIQGILMAMLGYCVVEINDNNFSAYIPRNITRNQYEWFDLNKSEISKCYINAEIIDEEEGIIQIRRQSTNSNPLVKLYSKLYQLIEEGYSKNDTRRSK